MVLGHNKRMSRQPRWPVAAGLIAILGGALALVNLSAVVDGLGGGLAALQALAVEQHLSAAPPMTAFSIRSASISAITSSATADCWPLRIVWSDRNRVEP